MTDALARQARIDARTLELIEEATTFPDKTPAGHKIVIAALETMHPRPNVAGCLRAALTEARRIATEEADADTTTTGGITP